MGCRNHNAMTPADYTVAIVCAIEFEMSAVRCMLDEEHLPLADIEGDSNDYILGQTCGHNVVLAYLPGTQGKGAAAIVATNLERTFPSIIWRFNTGIGGGVPSEKHDIQLGDVVVSMPEGTYGGVVQYDLGKDTDGGFKLKGFLSAPPPRIRAAVVKMQSDHRFEDNKVEGFVAAMLHKNKRFRAYQRPSAELDVLFDAGYAHAAGQTTCELCDKKNTVVRAPREYDGTEIHYGLIASGDRVLRSAVQRSLQVQTVGDILCFEMEAAGLMTELPYIVIRGISDYADSHKNDAWQHYAAAAAAACTKELLGYLNPAAARKERVSGSTRPMDGNRFQSYSSFKGKGVQNSGTGNVSIGGDIRIE